MRVPETPTPAVKRFLVGVVLGMLIGWLFFIYQYGDVHESLLLDIQTLESELAKQTRTIDILREDQVKQNEENERRLTVQEVRIIIANERTSKLSEWTLYELKDLIEQEVEDVRNKDIAHVAESRFFLQRMLENKTFTVNQQEYQVSLIQLFLYTTLEVHVEVHEASSQS
ncbi:hypothetical protein FLK61_35875 [Paenalkalicoccus suaedae]|uniref:Sporulation membrane protein YtrI C-terminal domain-containing protein n=1 Tax=Paenalkalicoccus suaedae TaxID=2592382 RepID=A0A859FHA0_9BACI|nr:sporulation membrane protein YtrI [Paenalkalicoccus suaedae]QKS72044.1 hypothetical protein FLK61_35875 [Paenalkalicoccus suaedae]